MVQLINKIEKNMVSNQHYFVKMPAFARTMHAIHDKLFQQVSLKRTFVKTKSTSLNLSYTQDGHTSNFFSATVI